jgi:hypothetical protein
MEIKTIDIQAKEWFDRANGNSYFATRTTINYGMDDQKDFFLPWQGGYGEHYIYEAGAQLNEHNWISLSHGAPLWRYCGENDIILRTSKQENCLKRDMVAWGTV